MRLAGNRLLAMLRRNAVPQGPAGWAMEVGPDLAMSTLVGVSTQSVPMALEDGALGLGGSFGGRAVGTAIGAALGGRGGAAIGANIGGLVGGMGVPMLAPRPIADSIRRKQEEQLAAEQMAREQGIFEQGIMAGAQQFAMSPRVQGADALISQLGFYG